MFAFLPLIALIFLLLIFRAKNRDWRSSCLSALVVWGVVLTLVTELCSLARLLTWEWLTTQWLIIDTFLVAIYSRFYRKRKKIVRQDQVLKRGNFLKRSWFSIVLLSGVALIVVLVGITAVVAAPSGTEPMVYYLSRVAHWVQNQSVGHYPTHVLRQLYHNPWAEFAITHLQILSESDRFANLIQWGSMLGSIIGVSLIARQLGADLRGQVLTAVICTTIPLGILQSSGTRNEYVAALWLVSLAYFILRTVTEGVSFANIFRVGASLGLALLTNVTAYIYAFPFCFWLVVWGVKTLRWQVWKLICTTLIIALAINLGHYWRNFEIFQSPLGISEVQLLEDFSLPIWISSIVKQLAFHADVVRNLGLQDIITPTTGTTNQFVRDIHGVLGLDVNDPRTMSTKASAFYVSGISTFEDTAGNPVHLLLVLLSALILIINKRLRRQRYLFGYFLVLASGFLLFCAFSTWAPWRCALHLPLFVLFSPFIGIVLSKSWKYQITNILAIILLLISHPWVLNNQLRPLVGNNNIFTIARSDTYLSPNSQLIKGYQKSVQIAQERKCFQVGLMGENIREEYPLWVMFQKSQNKVTIRHVNVINESAAIANQFPYKNYQPCTIISISKKQQQEELIIDNHIYHQYWSDGSIQVFVK
ncbi:MAG: 4-amino-4-deoxy-L-arabinose transferase [Xenococcaceae cyanobacterium MO_188.B29]|nr:4-amino-4-deoxy-L-arabinose transferase [Xenococcaceae cyanobacterium MO_188.B29]